MAFPQPFTQLPTVTPGQAGIKGAAGNQALKTLQGLGGGQFNFEPIAQQARTQFQQQTVPGLAERFTSLGGGAQRSSAFQGALGQAGAGLEQGLAALQSQYGLKQQGLQQQLLKMLLSTSLSPEFQNVENPEYKQFQELLSNLGGEDVQNLISSLFEKGGEGGAEEGAQEQGNNGGFWQSLFGLAPTAGSIIGGTFGGPAGAAAGGAAGTGVKALLNRIFG
jgi:hypothetical protein